MLAYELQAEAAVMLEEAVRSLADNEPSSVKNFHVKTPLDKYQEQHNELSAQRGGSNRKTNDSDW